jgi:tRNA G18 (ribose-2'-O)-methylase SpoU
MMADPLALFTRLRDRDYAREGLLVCEGRLVLEKALAAGLPIRSILCVPSDEDHWRQHAPVGTTILVLPRPELAAHVGFAFHRGVLALADRPHTFNPSAELTEAGGSTDRTSHPPASGSTCAIHTLRRDPGSHALVLWGVTDPDNLGALARSAAALGARSLWLGPGCADPYGRKALRASMGCTLVLPVFRIESVQDLVMLRQPMLAGGTGQQSVNLDVDFTAAVQSDGPAARTAVGPAIGTAAGAAAAGADLVRETASTPATGTISGTWTARPRRLLAAALVNHARPVLTCRNQRAQAEGFPAGGGLPAGGGIALVMGNEGWGLPSAVVEACDEAVMLPMSGDVDSLNVAAAGAIMMWELFRDA